MPKLSVTIITKNEAANIGAALESVAWADELVVVDAGSSDDTVAIARRFTDRVIVHPWPGFPQQKNHAASLASHDWILSIDADNHLADRAPLHMQVRRTRANLAASVVTLVGRIVCDIAIDIADTYGSDRWVPE